MPDDDWLLTLSNEQLEQLLLPFKPRMFELLEKTSRDDIERGFRVCLDESKKPIMLDICEGEKCGVVLSACKDGLSGFAGFHTHPRDGSWVPSPGDIVNGYGAGDIIECIGASARKKTSGVACYRIKHEDFPMMKKFIQSVLGDPYSDEAIGMMAEATFKPSQDTVFRRVFIWEGYPRK